ncbi:MAG: DNA/RNA nuclease SfsA [Clostridia bacterium]|nr:DNA/RNA nuclease SfsA [Clostridia bacterium]
MKYNKILKAKFISRPNRFIAHCELDGEEVICHVKNTGRCKELLTPGATVILTDERENKARKTPFDLISVYKGERLINMDSQAPNKVAEELMERLYPKSKIRREITYGKSRIDLFIENGEEKIFVEVKGVTLESDGVAKFPDAPTERGIKHLRELERAASEGYKAIVLFIIQMKGVAYFTPNRETHPQFADALVEVHENGVDVWAYDCKVQEGIVEADMPVEVRLFG